MKWLRKWVELWDTREHADSLALVRIFVPLVVIWDLLDMLRLGLVSALWAPMDEGGFGPASYESPTIELYQWLGASSQITWLLFVCTLLSALLLALGVFSRASALVLLLAYAQLEELSPDADRGIDTLLRNVLCILVFSRAGSTLSLTARLRRGSFVSDELVPAWPRYLIIVQLVLMYFFAGLSKSASNWSYGAGYPALFYVLHEPHYARVMLPHGLLVTLYPLVQLGTLSTVIWERSALAVPLLLWLRKTRERATFLHRWVNRLRLLEVWVATGVFFHLALATLLALGIFPWGCLALYPALARPDLFRELAEKLQRLLGSARQRGQPAAADSSP